MKTHQVVARLILKYQTSSLAEQEHETLQEWINRSERNQQLFKRLSDKAYWEKMRQIDLDKEWQKVVSPYPIIPVCKFSWKNKN